jgi:hypothetical protein
VDLSDPLDHFWTARIKRERELTGSGLRVSGRRREIRRGRYWRSAAMLFQRAEMEME